MPKWVQSSVGFHSLVKEPPEDLVTFSLFQKFESSGKFWLAGKPNEFLWGTLVFEPGQRIHVILNGAFSDMPKEPNYETRRSFLGVLYNGLKCTLLDYTTHIDTYRGEKDIYQTHVMANYLIGGEHYKELHKIKFPSLEVKFSHLDDWLSCPYQVKHKRDKSKSLVNFNPSKFKINMSLRNYTVIIELFCRRSIPFVASKSGTRWKYSYQIRISPDKSKSFPWYLDFLHCLRSFFVFLVGAGVYTLDLFAFLSDPTSCLEGEATEGEYVSIHLPVDVPSSIRIDPYYFSTHFEDIKTELPNVINKWFEKRTELKTATDAYTELLLNEGSYEEAIFLRVVQTLEHFHGTLKLKDTTLCRPDIWQNFIKKLEESFPRSIIQVDDKYKTNGQYSDLKSILIKRIAGLNNIAFKNRIKQLLEKMPRRLLMPILDNPKDPDQYISQFLGQVESTRNYLTHHGSKLEKRAVTGEKLRKITTQCWAVLSYWIAASVGFSEKKAGDISLRSMKATFLVDWRLGL